MHQKLQKYAVLGHFSCVRLFATLRTMSCQAPLPTGFSRQDCSSGWPCPPPGDLPNPSNTGLLCLLRWQPGSLPLASPGKPENTLSANVNLTAFLRYWQTAEEHFLATSPQYFEEEEALERSYLETAKSWQHSSQHCPVEWSTDGDGLCHSLIFLSSLPILGGPSQIRLSNGHLAWG